jgi:hypothetical protein
MRSARTVAAAALSLALAFGGATLVAPSPAQAQTLGACPNVTDLVALVGAILPANGNLATGVTLGSPANVTITRFLNTTINAAPANQQWRIVVGTGAGSSTYTPDLTAPFLIGALPTFQAGAGALRIHHWNTSANGFTGQPGALGGSLFVVGFCYQLSTYGATGPVLNPVPGFVAVAGADAAAPTTVPTTTTTTTTTTTIVNVGGVTVTKAPAAPIANVEGAQVNKPVAFTGFNAGALVRIAMSLTAFGLALVLLAQRRRAKHQHQPTPAA